MTPMRSNMWMSAGAASHILFTWGWFAKKSPPYTVSSRWRQVESFSPFVLMAAFTPPCAHAECERFTGTRENRSTGMPASAILSVAMRPARPPPTTTTLFLAMNRAPLC